MLNPESRMLTPIDIYCERTSAELFAEPLNAVTNISFLIAVWWLACRARQLNGWNGRMKLLVALVTAVGIGSALFHTFANRLTSLMDIIPILAFLCAYLAVFLRTALAWKAGKTALGVIGFVAACVLTQSLPFPAWTNGSHAYLPALLMLGIMGLWAFAYQHRQAAQYYVAAFTCFFFSMTLRTLDAPLCVAWPFGTHFLWHALNGVVIALAGRALLCFQSMRGGVASTAKNG